MKRTVETKFYHFNQNNSGGYFVNDDKHGICEDVIIEATSPSDAWERLEKIGEPVDGMFNYCSCCGERWSNWLDESDGKEVPMIYDTPVELCTQEAFRNKAFVHYFDGTKKEFVFPVRAGK